MPFNLIGVPSSVLVKGFELKRKTQINFMRCPREGTISSRRIIESITEFEVVFKTDIFTQNDTHLGMNRALKRTTRANPKTVNCLITKVHIHIYGDIRHVTNPNRRLDKRPFAEKMVPTCIGVVVPNALQTHVLRTNTRRNSEV